MQRAVEDLGFSGALINGLTEDRFLDGAFFDPILDRAEQLDVPLYLHPNVPPEAVRKAYFERLPGNTGFMLATGSWDWHAETAVHILRLVRSSTLDLKRPDLIQIPAKLNQR